MASGLTAPSGIAVASDGTTYFTDEVKGIFRMSPGGGPVRLSRGAERPGGLLLEDDGGLLLLAKRLRPGHGDTSRNGLLLRFDVVSKQFTILADGLRRPRGLARDAAGGILVTADGLRPDAECDDDDDGNDDDGDDPPLAGGVFRWTSGSGFETVLRGFKRPAGIAVEDSGSLLVAAERYGDRPGSLFRVAGETVSVVHAERLRRPTGVALDVTGAVFLTGRRHHAGSRSGVIVKLVEGRPAVDFATRLERPRYLAFAVRGELVATDAGAGLLLRFLAPPSPSVEAPTGQDPVLLHGTAQPGSEVLALGGLQPVRVLAGGDGAFELSVPVAPEVHELSVFAIGSAGRGLASAPTRLTVNGDDVPPEIIFSVEPPPNAAGWNRTDVTVTFTCTDVGSGVASCPDPVTVAAEGAGQVVTGTATDHAGNSASVSVTLNVDKTPPILTAVVTPAPNEAGWNNSDVTVSFDAQDALAGVLDVTAPVSVTSEGPSQVVAGHATDRAGNAVGAFATMNLARTPPVVTITTPSGGSVRHLPSVRVAGTAESQTAPIVSVKIGETEAGPGSVFDAEVALASGPQLLTVVARDIAGNEGTASVDITYRPLPAVRITSPANLSAFGSSPIDVRGTVDDPAATIRVGRAQVPATVSGNTFTATGVQLQEGGNVVTAVATNPRGDSSSDSVTLILDTTAPRVLVDSPAVGSVTTQSSITVTGRVNDVVLGTINSGQARVVVNGAPAAVSNRTFAAEGVALSPGLNTITATAFDAVGNSDTRVLTVMREALPGVTLVAASGNGQTAGIGEILPAPLVVSLRNPAGEPLAGQTVVFRVAANNGYLIDEAGRQGRGLAVTTGPDGTAAARYALGTRAGAGNNRVNVSLGALGPVVFTASARTDAPARIYVDSGGGQKAAVGQPLPRPFVAVVTDEGHNRLPGVPVTFTVEEGGGHFNGHPSLTVDTDTDGRAVAVLTLGPNPGIENNVVSVSIAGSPDLPAVFTASALEAGSPGSTRIGGVVLDNSNVPILGVTVRIRGTALAAATDEQGRFTLQGVPVGDTHLLVDGSTTQRPGTWPDLEYEIVTVPGVENTLGMPIYLLPLDLEHGIFVDETHGGTLTLPDYPGFSLTVAPNSATFPDGTRRGTVTVTAVHVDKVPMVPNFGQQPRFIVTIQPPGVRFDPPAQVTHPNVDGLAPGEVTELYSFDHDMGSFVATGTATVSEDGSVLGSDPGTGILKGGWHCGGNPARGGSSASLKVKLNPKPIKMQYAAATTPVTAAGSPPIKGVYKDWKVKNKTFDVDLDFTGQPPCPDQASCQNELKAGDYVNTGGHTPPCPNPPPPSGCPGPPPFKVCGTAEAEVTFFCTETGQQVKDTATIELGCRGKSAADCLSACNAASAQGMCGTPCSLIGATAGPPSQCWFVTRGGQNYCYWDNYVPNSQNPPGFVFLCCGNHCDNPRTFTQWGNFGPGVGFLCTGVAACNGTLLDASGQVIPCANGN